MNPLVLLSLVAVATAAPGGIFRTGAVGTVGLGAVTYSNVGPSGVVSVGAPAVAYATPVVHQQVVQPVVHQQVVQQVQVPVTKTVHYETKPVVTGYSTSIIKPAIPQIAHPQLVAHNVQQVVQAAPVQQVVQVQEQRPVAVAPAPVVTNDAVIVESRSAAIAPAPVAVAQPVVQQVAVRAAQAGDFGPLVTKEQVLAPVRTHTQITPQVTQIQPEVTVRKVITNVDVPHVAAVHTPVVHQVGAPVVQQTVVDARSVGVVGVNQHVLGPHAFGHQFVL